MAVNVGDLIARLTLDTSGFSAGLTAAEKQAQGFYGDLKDVDRGLVAVKGSSVVAGVALGQMFVEGLKKIALYITETVELGRQLRIQEGAFKAVTAAVGQNGAAIKTALDDATDSMLDFTRATSDVNRLLLQGFSSKQLEELGRVAKSAAVIMGTDVTTAFNQVSGAVLSGSERMLKQAGIYIDAQRAVTEYANTMGIAEKSLTEAGRSQAVFTAALAASRLTLSATASAMDPSIRKADQFQTKWKEMRDRVGEAADKIRTAIIGMLMDQWPEINKLIEHTVQLLNDLGGAATKLKPILSDVLGAINAFAERAHAAFETDIKDLEKIVALYEKIRSFITGGLPPTSVPIDQHKTLGPAFGGEGFPATGSPAASAASGGSAGGLPSAALFDREKDSIDKAESSLRLLTSTFTAGLSPAATYRTAIQALISVYEHMKTPTRESRERVAELQAQLHQFGIDQQKEADLFAGSWEMTAGQFDAAIADIREAARDFMEDPANKLSLGGFEMKPEEVTASLWDVHRQIDEFWQDNPAADMMGWEVPPDKIKDLNVGTRDAIDAFWRDTPASSLMGWDVKPEDIQIDFSEVLHNFEQYLDQRRDAYRAHIMELIGLNQLFIDAERENYLEGLEFQVRANELRASAATREQTLILRNQIATAQGALGAWHAFTAGFQLEVLSWGTLMQQFGRLGADTARLLTTSLSEGFFDLITGKLEDLEDVWTHFWQSMLRMILDFLASAAVAELVKFLAGLGGISIGGGGGSGGAGGIGGSVLTTGAGAAYSYFGGAGAAGATAAAPAGATTGATVLPFGSSGLTTGLFGGGAVAAGGAAAGGGAVTGAGGAFAGSSMFAAEGGWGAASSGGAASAATAGGGEAGAAGVGGASVGAVAGIAAIAALIGYGWYTSLEAKKHRPESRTALGLNELEAGGSAVMAGAPAGFNRMEYGQDLLEEFGDRGLSKQLGISREQAQELIVKNRQDIQALMDAQVESILKGQQVAWGGTTPEAFNSVNAGEQQRILNEQVPFVNKSLMFLQNQMGTSFTNLGGQEQQSLANTLGAIGSAGDVDAVAQMIQAISETLPGALRLSTEQAALLAEQFVHGQEAMTVITDESGKTQLAITEGAASAGDFAGQAQQIAQAIRDGSVPAAELRQHVEDLARTEGPEFIKQLELAVMNLGLSQEATAQLLAMIQEIAGTEIVIPVSYDVHGAPPGVGGGGVVARSDHQMGGWVGSAMDTVEPGEFVVRADVARRHGPALEALNAGLEGARSSSGMSPEELARWDREIAALHEIRDELRRRPGRLVGARV